MNHGPVGFINSPLSGIHNYQENFDGAKSSRRAASTFGRISNLALKPRLPPSELDRE
jgi:hypothetical protein